MCLISKIKLRISKQSIKNITFINTYFLIMITRRVKMNCGWIQAVLAVLILVFAFWPTQIVSSTVSMWIVIVSAALLLIHAVVCMKCNGICAPMSKKRRR